MSFDFTDYKQRTEKTLEFASTEFASLRTGRASVQALDPVTVEAYGTRMKLQEVANVTAPDPTLLVVKPWDKSLLSAIEKAIASAGLNLQPIVDSDLIRISVPPLTEDKRKEMVKLLHQKAENIRVMLRSVRIDTKKDIERQEGKDGISEDDITADEARLDELGKQILERLELVVKKKEAELLTV